MTDREIQEWMETLSQDPQKQCQIIADLLAHANEDRMSAEDRIVCRKALRLPPELTRNEG